MKKEMRKNAREAVMAPWHNLYLEISICLL